MGALGDDTITRMRSIKKQNGYLDVEQRRCIQEYH